MSRLFWVGVGVAAGVALSRKAGRAAKAATPSGIAANVGDAMRELAGAIGAFGADVRAGMVEREEELTDQVERKSGIATGGARPSYARARRAGGNQPSA